MPLKTNVYLRRAEREDLDTVVAWMDDPDFLFFLYGDPTRSAKQLRTQIVGMLGRTSGDSMPRAIHLLIDSDDSDPVGMLSIQRISWRNRSCCLDLYIGQKNLRSSMVAAMSTFRAIEYCFDELNLNRITAFIYAFNRASWRLMERTGAVREMTFEEHVARDGELHDLYCYGLLRDEFEEFRAQFKDLKGMSLAAMIEEREAAQETPG